MMQVFRFMSKNEFDKFVNGEILVNNKDFKAMGMNTNSVGFCFMDIEDDSPEMAYEYLSGIVSNEVCCIFETDEQMCESYGIYADPNGNFFDTIYQREYCIREYSNKNFKLISYADNIDVFEEWEWKEGFLKDE